MARIVEFIFATEPRGEGTQEDPCRSVSQLWTKDGQLVAEYEPGNTNRIAQVFEGLTGAGKSWWNGVVGDGR